MAADTVQFYSQNEKVVGKFFPANGKVRKTILLLHGFPGNPDDVLGLGERLSDKGYNVFTFNYRGTYDSEGNHGLESSQQDIASAYAYLCQDDVAREYNVDTSKLILGGYSFGGGMALTFAANSNRFSRVFAVAPTDHGQFARDVQNSKDYHDAFHAGFESLRKPNGPVSFEGDDFFAELLENADYYDLRLAVPHLVDKDLLLMYGIDDASVTLEDHGLPFYRSLSDAEDASFEVKFFRDDHSFGNSRDDLAESILNWISNSDEVLSDPRSEDADIAKKMIRATGYFSPNGAPSSAPNRTDGGGSCIVDLVQDYTVSGTLSGQFTIDYRIKVDGPCGAPLGTHDEDWIAHGTFSGTLNEVTLTSSFTYVAHVSAGGDVDGKMVFGQGLSGKLEVRGNFADGKLSYDGSLNE